MKSGIYAVLLSIGVIGGLTLWYGDQVILPVLVGTFGWIFLLFLPGFAWSFIIFKDQQIEWVERVALSFGISVVLVPLAMMWLNLLLHVEINVTTTYSVGIGLVGAAYLTNRIRANGIGTRAEKTELHKPSVQS